MVTFNRLEKNGNVLYYNYVGNTKRLRVSIIDGYTKLLFYSSTRIIKNKEIAWIIMPYDVKHKIYQIHDDHQSNLLLEIKTEEGTFDLSLLDKKSIFKNIGDCNINHTTLALPLYEIFLKKIYDHAKCQVKSGDVVLDVGANIGFFTYYCLYKNAKFVYSIEPNSNLSNVIKNRKLENVQVDNVALSDSNGRENFYISNTGISSCFEKFNDNIAKLGDSYIRGDERFELTSVNKVSVMDYIYINKIDKIDFLKLDCEGAEYSIINSLSEDFLKNNVDRLLIEYHFITNSVYLSKYNKLVEKIKNCGFKIDNKKEADSFGLLYCWK